MKLNQAALVNFFVIIVTSISSLNFPLKLFFLLLEIQFKYYYTGWRPSNIDQSCQSFPLDAPQPKGNELHPMDCQVKLY